MVPGGVCSDRIRGEQPGGGHLVTINDAPENDWIHATFGPHVSGNYGALGIGVNDLAEEGSYVWTSGEADTFLNWDPNWHPPFGPEPDGGPDDVVGMTIRLWTAGTWHDFNTDPDDKYGPIDLYPIVEVVPEPSAFTLLALLGLMGGGIMWRRGRDVLSHE